MKMEELMQIVKFTFGRGRFYGRSDENMPVTIETSDSNLASTKDLNKMRHWQGSFNPFATSVRTYHDRLPSEAVVEVSLTY